jgi:hypothetical protein
LGEHDFTVTRSLSVIFVRLRAPLQCECWLIFKFYAVGFRSKRININIPPRGKPASSYAKSVLVKSHAL